MYLLQFFVVIVFFAVIAALLKVGNHRPLVFSIGVVLALVTLVDGRIEQSYEFNTSKPVSLQAVRLSEGSAMPYGAGLVGVPSLAPFPRFTGTLLAAVPESDRVAKLSYKWVGDTLEITAVSSRTKAPIPVACGLRQFRGVSIVYTVAGDFKPCRE